MSEDDKATEWWWIDYLENEMDPALDKDLMLLLEHSEEDRNSFERFRVLREWLRAADPVVGWPIEERLVGMRCRVMREIERDSYRASGARDTKSLSV